MPVALSYLNRRHKSLGLDCKNRAVHLTQNRISGITDEKPRDTGAPDCSHNQQICFDCASQIRYQLLRLTFVKVNFCLVLRQAIFFQCCI